MLGAGRTLLTVHLGETEEKASYMRNAAEILNEQLEAGDQPLHDHSAMRRGDTSRVLTPLLSHLRSRLA